MRRRIRRRPGWLSAGLPIGPSTERSAPSSMRPDTGLFGSIVAGAEDYCSPVWRKAIVRIFANDLRRYPSDG